jgi:chemotaxis regulatin CheY-phosphate phosphatase CheZ
MAMPAEKRDAFDSGDFDPAMVGELEPKLINLMQQSEALVALMRGFFQQLDKRRSEEFSIIAGYIAKAKEEIREMRPHDISQDRIPTAGAELEAITRDTENATHAIMNSAEAIMGYDGSDPDYKTKVDDEVMKIFEACSFQDITGQRVSKVVNVLKQIEERVGRLASTLGIDDGAPREMSAEEKRRHDLLLNGPAIGGPETKQDAIDAMFDEAPAAPAVTPDALAAKAPAQAPVAKAPEPAPAPKPAAAPAAKAPEPAPAPKPAAPAPAPAPAPAAEEKNSQDDIDALFDIAPEDMGKTNSQDDIDALFD